MSAAFSSREEECLNKTVELDNVNNIGIVTSSLEETFLISDCAKWIKDIKAKKVSLQFPDDLLCYSAEIALALEDAICNKVFILGDTSYGSCCVDEVAAEHIQSDALIHFGHSCMSETKRLPVLFVLPRINIDAQHVITSFQEIYPKKDSKVILFTSTGCYWIQDAVFLQLCNDYTELRCGLLTSSEKCVIAGCNNTYKPSHQNCEKLTICGRNILFNPGTKIEDYEIFYIGDRNRSFTNLTLSLDKCQFTLYNARTKEISNRVMDLNKFLMKRYYVIEKAKDAKRIGILIGTLGVSKYLQIINHLMKLARSVGKKAYMISVGKPNPAKLANFAEIDVFIYVACMENSLADSKDFYQPILTPFEFEVACNKGRDWSSEYITEFHRLLEGGNRYIPLTNPTENEEDNLDVSLISGSIRNLSVNSSTILTTQANETSLLSRDPMAVSSLHAGGGGEFLTERSWKGLEQNLGETSPSIVAQGRMGIASGYQGEGVKGD